MKGGLRESRSRRGPISLSRSRRLYRFSRATFSRGGGVSGRFYGGVERFWLATGSDRTTTRTITIFWEVIFPVGERGARLSVGFTVFWRSKALLAGRAERSRRRTITIEETRERSSVWVHLFSGRCDYRFNVISLKALWRLGFREKLT